MALQNKIGLAKINKGRGPETPKQHESRQLKTLTNPNKGI